MCSLALGLSYRYSPHSNVQTKLFLISRLIYFNIEAFEIYCAQQQYKKIAEC